MEKKTKLTISGGIAKKSIKNIDKAKNLGRNSVVIEKQTGKLSSRGGSLRSSTNKPRTSSTFNRGAPSKPLQADTLNYLGFTTRKLGDYENGEKYYLLGLEIDPNHKGINEYLGELYVATNRMDLAKERLKVLETCNCEEYNELKEIIEGTKKSKY